jgi:hypothetical protein
VIASGGRASPTSNPYQRQRGGCLDREPLAGLFREVGAGQAGPVRIGAIGDNVAPHQAQRNGANLAGAVETTDCIEPDPFSQLPAELIHRAGAGQHLAGSVRAPPRDQPQPATHLIAGYCAAGPAALAGGADPRSRCRSARRIRPCR